MQQTNNYAHMMGESITYACQLGLKNLNWTELNYKYQEKHETDEILNLVNGELFDFIEHTFAQYDYWGNSCLDLAAAAFCFLKAKGYDVEMIYGNINVNSSTEDEFSTTKEYLAHEYQNKIGTGIQDIHAWVGIGGNMIIDFAIMDRLFKHYKYPREFGNVIFGHADFIKETYKVIYKPLLIGTDFFKNTNSYDPLDNLERLKVFFNSRR